MLRSTLFYLLVGDATLAFPFVANMPGVDTTLLHHNIRRQAGGSDTCAFNPNHEPAAPITSEFPYNNAKNGLRGNEKGGYLVPAIGDTAHEFRAPDYSRDIRGPCPGLNVAANHGFLPRDGIVTYNELLDAQQNVFNIGYDLANLLNLVGLTTTNGDTISGKLSIGCDATSRTSFNPAITGNQPGLNGHNKFEADTSLTRNDYFTHNGDNYKMNATLFSMMTETTGGLYNLEGLAKYRKQRWDQSQAENPNFYFGPFAVVQFGAASFLYEVYPSGPDYIPDVPTISSFFGAEQDSNGEWFFNGKERIPENWINRVEPVSIPVVAQNAVKMYSLAPVAFGGNTGPGQFNAIDWKDIKEGRLENPSTASMMCFLYQLVTERVPSSLNSVVAPTVDQLSKILTTLNPVYKNLGCPLRLN